jgi:hypothetical protein
MLWTLSLVFLVLWGLGLVTQVTLGGLIHILLFAAVVSLLVDVLRGPRAA